MTKSDKILLDLVKSDIKRYEIIIGSDVVWVGDKHTDDIVEDFDANRDELLLTVLEYIGITAEYC